MWWTLYILAGPAAWSLFALGFALAHARMNRLRRPVSQIAQFPSVSILIPAKDEGEGLRKCLNSVLATDYPNFRIIGIDDRSCDQTGPILDEYAARNPSRFSALHITDLPDGWLGKCNALATAAKTVEGEWILFVDSDVKVEPDALSAVLALAIGREYDAVSIMTRLECHGFWEPLILPLCAASVGAMTLMSLTNDDNRRRFAFANGQFFLIRRSAYEAIGGHGAVRDNITEDVALMRLLKSADYRTRLFFGRDFASTRMHTSLHQMFNGWARIFSGVSNRKTGGIWLNMLFLLSGFLAYAAIAYGAVELISRGQSRWLIAGGVQWVVMTVVLMLVYRLSGNGRRYALLFPIGGAMLLAIDGYALRACRTGKIAWRGTVYRGGSVRRLTEPPQNS